jgi:hypothetical protein
MSLAGFIRGILGNDIEVTLSPTLVTFKCNGGTQSFEPIIYVARDSHQLIAVGTAKTSLTPCIKVELFGPTEGGEIPLNKQECLAMFFRYAFCKMARRKVFVRPRVIFYGSDSINHLLSSYQRGILFDAVAKAGARECHFKS